MKTLKYFFIATVLTCVFTMAQQKSKVENKDPLKGQWKIITVDGQSYKHATWNFADGKFEMFIAQQKFVGSYHYFLDKTPQQVKITMVGEPSGGESIFKIEKDTLTLKLRDSRAKSFASDFQMEKGYDLFLCERVSLVQKDPLLGKWQIGTVDGRSYKNATWEFSNGQFVMFIAGQKFVGSYSYSLNKKPQRVEITMIGEPSGGGLGHSIFKIEKDTLTLKLRDSGTGSFASDFKIESGYDLYVCQKMKPKDD